MKNIARLVARLNTWIVPFLGLGLGLNESSTKLYTSYPYKYEFDWWLFIKWAFATYCFTMLFYILSEILKEKDKESNLD